MGPAGNGNSWPKPCPLQRPWNLPLKGYQWPFDAGKVAGSSLVDLLVYRERQAGRRVFLDYRANPRGLEGGFEATPAEARDYLERSGALFGTPTSGWSR